MVTTHCCQLYEVKHRLVRVHMKVNDKFCLDYKAMAERWTELDLSGECPASRGGILCK